jgi:hypothetical protein
MDGGVSDGGFFLWVKPTREKPSMETVSPAHFTDRSDWV